MVTILGYNNSETQYINEILEKKNVPFNYSLLEKQITIAEKIILPHPHNFSSAYKRMQMMNLFSYLRMLKKPILGINDGFSLMCSEILDKYKCGLGFFEVKVNSNALNETDLPEFETGKVLVKSGSELVSLSLNNTEIKFNKNRQMGECEFSKSIIKFENKVYTLTCEHKNYYSVELNFEQNPLIAENIISNFVSL